MWINCQGLAGLYAGAVTGDSGIRAFEKSTRERCECRCSLGNLPCDGQCPNIIIDNGNCGGCGLSVGPISLVTSQLPADVAATCQQHLSGGASAKIALRYQSQNSHAMDTPEFRVAQHPEMPGAPWISYCD